MTDLLQSPWVATPSSETPGGPSDQQEPVEPDRFRPKNFSASDVGWLAGTLACSLAVVWGLFSQLTLLSGPFGFLVCWVGLFLALYWFVNLQVHDRLVATDRLVTAVVVVTAGAMLTPLVLITGYVFVKGWHLLSLHAFTHDQKGVLEFCPSGTRCVSAGVAHAIVGTLEQAAIAAVIGVPIGILTAVFVNEVRGGRLTQRVQKTVRVVVTAMSGVPSIVAGIFIYAVWVSSQQGLGMGFSGFAGSLALAVMLLPSVTRGTEEVLKVVHNDLREAAQALGSHEWRTVWSVVLPTARSGVITAVLLGIARIVGETAPLLVTIFGNTILNSDPLHGPQQALPLLVYEQVKLPLASAVSLGFMAALVLYLMVFVLFVLARLLGGVRVKGGLRYRRRTPMETEMVLAAAEGVRGGEFT